MESRLEESQRWMAKAHSSLTAAGKLLNESLLAESITDYLTTTLSLEC